MCTKLVVVKLGAVAKDLEMPAAVVLAAVSAAVLVVSAVVSTLVSAIILWIPA